MKLIRAVLEYHIKGFDILVAIKIHCFNHMGPIRVVFGENTEVYGSHFRLLVLY